MLRLTAAPNLSGQQRLIFSAVLSNPGSTEADLARLTGVQSNLVNRQVYRMERMGLLHTTLERRKVTPRQHAWCRVVQPAQESEL